MSVEFAFLIRIHMEKWRPENGNYLRFVSFFSFDSERRFLIMPWSRFEDFSLGLLLLDTV